MHPKKLFLHLVFAGSVSLATASDAAPAVLAPVIAGGPSGAAAKPALLGVGTEAPDFLMHDVAGQEVRLSDFKGKVVILDFWATWCGPCMAAFPHTQEIAAKYKDQDVIVLGAGTSDKIAKFREWIPQNQSKYPDIHFAYDLNERESLNFEERASAKLYHVAGIPTQFVIGRDGKIAGVIVGNGGAGDARTEFALANAGVKVAEAILARGREQVAKETQASAATAALEVKKPTAPFRESYGKLKAGETVPDFTILTPDGQEAKFSDYARGKTVVLDFWASWCGPCQQAMPHYDEMQRKYGDKGVVFLGVCSFDTRANYEKWLVANKGKYSFATVFDPIGKPAAGDKEGYKQTIMVQMSGGAVTPLPTTLVIDRDRKLVGGYVGYGEATHAGLANLLMFAGIELSDEDKPKTYFPKGYTIKPKPAPLASPAGSTAAVATLKPAPSGDKAPEQKLSTPAANAIDAAETAQTPPPFFESMGKLVAGQPLPRADFTAQGPDGASVKFSDLSRGKITVLNVWSTSNAGNFLAFQEAWARKYAGQNVQFVALASYGTREEYDKFITEHAGQFSFPMVFDPVGRFAAPAKPTAAMSIEEKKQFTARQREHLAKVIAMQLAGGMMLPIPHNLVLDAQGRLLGGYVGAGEKSAPALGNLLHRAGVKLAPEDMPKHLYTAEETKPKVPPAKVEMLQIGALAPDFPATNAAGQTVKVSDYRGKVVILDFWATWCGPCINSMPHTQEVAEHYKDQGVVVLASCTSDTRAKFDAWVKANQARFPDMIFSHDPLEKSDDRAARKLYGVGGIPQQFIIGRDGRIAALCTGYLHGEVLLEAALARAGVKVAPEILEQAGRDQANRDAMK